MARLAARSPRGLVHVLVLVCIGGCDAFTAVQRPVLFTVPLSVNGQDVGHAVLDTGGAYEILLREDFGLRLIGRVDVLAFGGRELLDVTEQFSYTVGGVTGVAPLAIVGLSACDCNGVGFQFFREARVPLCLDFSASQASFELAALDEPAMIPFAAPPRMLFDFDTAFIPVEIGLGGDVPSAGQALPVTALLDTGAATTVVRRSLLTDEPSTAAPRRMVTIAHPQLGTLRATVILFDTEGLPDVILGTDAMGAWADQWCFEFAEQGGTIRVGGRRGTQIGVATATASSESALVVSE